MRRVLCALQEWLQRRARLREEHQFHLERAAAEFRGLGLSAREAKRTARARFGDRRNLRLALRELGGDLPGLAHLLQAHRVVASPWLQPIVLLAAVVLILLASPAPRDLLEGVVGPARAIWLLIALYAVFSLRACASRFSGRWLLFGFAGTGLHAFASWTAWAFANQLWNRTAWSTDGTAVFSFSVLMVAFLGIAAIQCRCWWSDLGQRCPVCLDRLLLPATEGAADSVLFDPAVTESICAHGHGVLVESRWTRRFRPQESPLDALVHF